MHDKLTQAFPFLRQVPDKLRDEFLAQSVHKNLEHKQVLVRDGRECAWLPFAAGCPVRTRRATPVVSLPSIV